MKRKPYAWAGALLTLLCAGGFLLCSLTGNAWFLGGLTVLVMLLNIIAGSVFVLVASYLIRPRFGLHYRHWNRFLGAIVGSLVLGEIGGMVLIGYLCIKFDAPDSSVETFLGVWVFGFLAAWALWFRLWFMPVWGFWRLRWQYPAMVEGAIKLKSKNRAVWYAPLVFVQGRPFLVFGYDSGGMVILDERGQRVSNREQAETLIRCYKLALNTLHAPDSLKRAREIDSLRQTDRKVRGMFRRFRSNEAYCRAAGEHVSDLWQRICDFEAEYHAILQNQIDRKMWQVRWAVEHGSHRLTQVSDEQLHDVERCLTEYDTQRVAYRPRVEQSALDAEELFRALPERLVTPEKKVLRPKRPRALKEMMDAVAALREESAGWQETASDFAPAEDDWRTWYIQQGLPPPPIYIKGIPSAPYQHSLSRMEIERQMGLKLPQEAYGFRTHVVESPDRRMLFVAFELSRSRLERFLKEAGFAPLEPGCWPFDEVAPLRWWPQPSQFHGVLASKCAGRTIEVPEHRLQKSIGVNLDGWGVVKVYLLYLDRQLRVN